MNLSSNEETAYKAIYNKIASSGTQFTKGVCVKLMVKRGQIPAETAAKVFYSIEIIHISFKRSGTNVLGI